MTASTAQTEPAKRRRRRTPAVLAVLFLLIGAGLLSFSFYWYAQPASMAAPAPIASPSPTVQTFLPSATMSPGATGAPPVVVVATSYVFVPITANPQASSGLDSGVLALVTTVSGLLASLAGIVSAVLSFRGPRPR